MMLRGLLAVSFVLALPACAIVPDWPWSARNRPPKHKDIEEAYFVCSSCRSAEGGIFGKGPVERHYAMSLAPKCTHQWRRVSKAEFKRSVASNFGVDWSEASLFWRGDHRER